MALCGLPHLTTLRREGWLRGNTTTRRGTLRLPGKNHTKSLTSIQRKTKQNPRCNLRIRKISRRHTCLSVLSSFDENTLWRNVTQLGFSAQFCYKSES